MDRRLWLFGETGMLLPATEMKRVSVEKNYKGQMHWMLTKTILFSGFKSVKPMVLSSSRECRRHPSSWLKESLEHRSCWKYPPGPWYLMLLWLSSRIKLVAWTGWCKSRMVGAKKYPTNKTGNKVISTVAVRPAGTLMVTPIIPHKLQSP